MRSFSSPALTQYPQGKFGSLSRISPATGILSPPADVRSVVAVNRSRTDSRVRLPMAHSRAITGPDLSASARQTARRRTVGNVAIGCAFTVGNEICGIQASARCPACTRPYCEDHAELPSNRASHNYRPKRLCLECAAQRDAREEQDLREHAEAGARAWAATQEAIERSRVPMDEADLRHYLQIPRAQRQIRVDGAETTRYFSLEPVPASIYGRAVRDAQKERRNDGYAQLKTGLLRLRGWGIGRSFFVARNGDVYRVQSGSGGYRSAGKLSPNDLVPVTALSEYVNGMVTWGGPIIDRT